MLLRVGDDLMQQKWRAPHIQVVVKQHLVVHLQDARELVAQHRAVNRVCVAALGHEFEDRARLPDALLRFFQIADVEVHDVAHEIAQVRARCAL